MARLDSITDVAEWQKLWESVKPDAAVPMLILKRSPICPTSHFAERIFNHFVSQIPDDAELRVYSVDVIGARPVSQRIAADTGITHESPQALLIKGGRKVAWHASHGDIDQDALTKHVWNGA